MLVIPAILELHLKAIESKTKQLDGLAQWVQVDICDGLFVPSKTYASSARATSIENITHLLHTHKVRVSLDMMVDFDCPRRMTRWSKVLAQSGVDQVIFHLGSTYRWDELFNRMYAYSPEGLGFECGLAIRIGTPRAEIRKVLASRGEIGFIQIMGIEQIGVSGAKMSDKLFPYISKITRSFPNYPIQIDGGVKEEHLEKLASLGVERVGMNSGFFKHEHKKALVQKAQGL